MANPNPRAPAALDRASIEPWPRRAARHLAQRAEGCLLLLPYLLGLVGLVGVPAVLSLAFSLLRYDGFSGPEWVGLANFTQIAADMRLGMALENSLYYVGLAVPLRTLGALGLALLFHESQSSSRSAGVLRALVCLPTMTPDAAYALLWAAILNPQYGPLNALLSALGLAAPAWLAEPEWAKMGLVIMSLFQVGEGFLVLLAGLQSIPKDCFEAAAVDGSEGWRTLRFITLPLLLPWLALLTLRDIVMSFQATITPAYLMTGGGPYYATLFLPMLAYEEAFDGLRFGHGAAITVLMLSATAVVVVAAVMLLRGWRHGDDF